MKCFNHIDRDAVGQCTACGKGLCKECFTKNNGVCDDCIRAEKKADFEDLALDLYGDFKEYRKSIKKAIIWSIVFGVIFVGVAAFFLIPEMGLNGRTLLILLAVFGFPFGFNTLTHVFGKEPNEATHMAMAAVAADSDNDTLSSFGIGYLIAKCFGLFWKVSIAGVIGIPCIIYLIIKLKSTDKQIAELADTYSKGMDNFSKQEQMADEQVAEEVQEAYYDKDSEENNS